MSQKKSRNESNIDLFLILGYESDENFNFLLPRNKDSSIPTKVQWGVLGGEISAHLRFGMSVLLLQLNLLVKCCRLESRWSKIN